MTVKVISVEELKPLLSNSHPCAAVSINIRDDVIAATSKETWDFVKAELAKEPDMTFTCSTSIFNGASCKKFTFTGKDNDPLLQTVNFINRTVNQNQMETLEKFRDQYTRTSPSQGLGAQAACPLFK